MPFSHTANRPPIPLPIPQGPCPRPTIPTGSQGLAGISLRRLDQPAYSGPNRMFSGEMGRIVARTRFPSGLQAGGKRLWKQVLDQFELSEHEEAVLLQACRTADVLDRLQAVIDAGDVVVQSPQGMKANPAIVEFRQQALTLAKCMASLRIPMGEEEAQGRAPQQRVGVRAPKGLKAV